MAQNAEHEFRMQIAGERPFAVYRFGWDPKGFHDDPSVGAQSDSLTASFLGRRYSLQHLCKMVEELKTMLFIKPSDLVTVSLVEAYLKKKPLDHLFFGVKEMVNGRRTTGFVATLYMKNVSIENLRTRQPLVVWQADWVTLRADEAHAAHRPGDAPW